MVVVPGSAADGLARLADGHLVTQLLHVAIALGVPDALAGVPRDADDLAGELGAVPGPLRRVLRGLAAEEVLDELPDGRFALTATGHLASMADRSAREAGAVVAAYDMTRLATTSPPACPAARTPTCCPGSCTTGTTATRCGCCGAAGRRCGRDSVLLVVEAVLPRRAVEDPAAVRMDLHMLVLLHGRERTAAEYAAPLEGAGLRLVSDVPTADGVHALEARPRR